MKTITGILLVFALAVLTSCVGEPGPPGPPGEDGDSFIGSVFEIEGDFTASNDYSLFFEFPNTIEVFESDVVLVYILWEQTTDNNGDPVDVWRLLPQTVVLNDGILQYNYDHTFNDVQVFLEGTTDFNNLLPAEWQDQVFRIAVLPADYAMNKNLDVSDFGSVMQALKIHPAKIDKFTVEQKELLKVE
jgi:hypothetical protein